MSEDAISRADALRVVQEARERGTVDLREILAELKTLPAASSDEYTAFSVSPSDAEQLSELRKVLQTLRHHLWNQPDIVTLIDMALTPKQLEKKGRQQ